MAGAGTPRPGRYGSSLRKESIMRGKILQYNGNDGTGIVVADGQQHRFGIAAWKSETPPAVGKTVEIVVAGDAVVSVMLVGEDVLLREKTAELTGKLGHLVGEMGSGRPKARSQGAGGADRKSTRLNSSH